MEYLQHAILIFVNCELWLQYYIGMQTVANIPILKLEQEAT